MFALYACLNARRESKRIKEGETMPALGSRQPINYQWRDYTGEVKSIPNMYVGEVTAITLPALLPLLATLEGALDAITLGVRAKNTLAMETYVSNAKPASKYAQVESQLLVSLWGATTEAPFSFRIPTIDPDKLVFVDGAEDLVLIGTGESTETRNLIDAIEAVMKTPWDDGEAVVVKELRFVGANI